jgi:hypothetical protein
VARARPTPATSAAPERVESSTTRSDGRGRQPGVPGGCRPRSRTDTYSVLSSTVSTMKKSVARMPAACARRNARQFADARHGADGGDGAAARREYSSPTRRSRACGAHLADAGSPTSDSPASSGGRPGLRGWVHFAGDHGPMPAQQRLWRDQERPPRRPGQRPVLDALHLAAQHRDLMLQHENLKLLGGVAAGSPGQQGHQSAREQIRERQHRQTMIPNSRR